MALVRVCGAVRRGVQTCGMRTVHCHSVCVELGTQPEHSTNPRHVLGWRGVATDCKEGITRGGVITLAARGRRMATGLHATDWALGVHLCHAARAFDLSS